MGLQTFLQRMNLPKRHLVGFVSYLIVLMYICVSSFASVCLGLGVFFLVCTTKHFIDTHSSSQCIDFPLVNAG